MSDQVYKIIPKSPYTKVSQDKLNAAKSFIESTVTCDCVDLEVTDNPEFIDCGSNLVNITCPKCGKEVRWINFCSPAWTWQHLCGRKGPLAICEDCHEQVYFDCEVMN
jgi:hypothetical protein